MTTKPTASSSLSLDVILATATGDKSGSLVDGFSAGASKFSTGPYQLQANYLRYRKRLTAALKGFASVLARSCLFPVNAALNVMVFFVLSAAPSKPPMTKPAPPNISPPRIPVPAALPMRLSTSLSAISIDSSSSFGFSTIASGKPCLGFYRRQ